MAVTRSAMLRGVAKRGVQAANPLRCTTPLPRSLVASYSSPRTPKICDTVTPAAPIRLLSTTPWQRRASRDPLQAEREAGTVAGNRAARARAEALARDPGGSAKNNSGQSDSGPDNSNSNSDSFGGKLIQPSALCSHSRLTLSLFVCQLVSQRHGDARRSNGIRYRSCSEAWCSSACKPGATIMPINRQLAVDEAKS